MNITQHIMKAILPIILLVPCLASADVIKPYVDIANIDDDAGFSLVGLGGDLYNLDIDATAFSIITLTGDINIPNQSFALDATNNALTPSLFSGTFNIGGGLLAGTFSGLTLSFFDNTYAYEASLIYTSGSLMGSLSSGRIEGIYDADLDKVSAKVGEVAVVPVPAAAWLFGSGLIGLVGIARRKTA